MPDFNLIGAPGDTVFLLDPETDAGATWIDENVGAGAQYLGRMLVVEHRYIFDIVEGLQADGYSIEGEALA